MRRTDGSRRSTNRTPAAATRLTRQKQHAHERERLEVPEGLRSDVLRRVQHLDDGDRREEGRVLEHRNHVVAECGHDRRQRLRQDDAEERPPRAEVERRGRLPLSAGHGIDASPVHFRGVGAVVQAERQHAGRERRGPDADVRHHIEQDIDLDQERRASDEFDHAPRGQRDEPPRRPEERGEEQPGGEGERGAEGGRQHRDAERVEEARQHRGGERPVPVEPHAGLRQAARRRSSTRMPAVNMSATPK